MQGRKIITLKEQINIINKSNEYHLEKCNNNGPLSYSCKIRQQNNFVLTKLNEKLKMEEDKFNNPPLVSPHNKKYYENKLISNLYSNMKNSNSLPHTKIIHNNHKGSSSIQSSNSSQTYVPLTENKGTSLRQIPKLDNKINNTSRGPLSKQNIFLKKLNELLRLLGLSSINISKSFKNSLRKLKSEPRKPIYLSIPPSVKKAEPLLKEINTIYGTQLIDINEMKKIEKKIEEKSDNKTNIESNKKVQRSNSNLSHDLYLGREQEIEDNIKIHIPRAVTNPFPGQSKKMEDNLDNNSIVVKESDSSVPDPPKGISKSPCCYLPELDQIYDTILKKEPKSILKEKFGDYFNN